MKKLNIVDVVQYLFFLGLFVISIIFMKEGIAQFASHDTSFKESEVAITEYPTFTFCFLNDNLIYAYGNNFAIQYEGENINLTSIDADSESGVRLVQVFSYFLENPCYRIKNMSEVDSNSITISVVFDANMSLEELPDIEFFMSSELNADGVIFKEWMDGSELKFHFDKVCILLFANMFEF